MWGHDYHRLGMGGSHASSQLFHRCASRQCFLPLATSKQRYDHAAVWRNTGKYKTAHLFLPARVYFCNNTISPRTSFVSSSICSSPILHCGCLRRSVALPGLNSNNPSHSWFQGIWLCPKTTQRASGNSWRATRSRLRASPRICTMPILQCPTTISRLTDNFFTTSSPSTLPCTATTGAIVSNSAMTHRIERSPAWIINSTSAKCCQMLSGNRRKSGICVSEITPIRCCNLVYTPFLRYITLWLSLFRHHPVTRISYAYRCHR